MSEVTINLDDLTIGDIEDAEAIVGRPLLGKLNPDRLDALTLQALVVVQKRKSGEPEFSLEDARLIKARDLNATATPDPTEAGTSSAAE